MISRRLLNASLVFLHLSPSDGSWGKSDEYTEEAESYPCRIQPVSRSEFIDGRVRSDAEYTVFLDYMEGVREEDRIKISGTVYEIVEVKNAAGHYHHLELGVKRV